MTTGASAATTTASAVTTAASAATTTASAVTTAASAVTTTASAVTTAASATTTTAGAVTTAASAVTTAASAAATTATAGTKDFFQFFRCAFHCPCYCTICCGCRSAFDKAVYCFFCCTLYYLKADFCYFFEETLSSLVRVVNLCGKNLQSYFTLIHILQTPVSHFRF